MGAETVWSEEKEQEFQKKLEAFKEHNARIPTLEEEASIWERMITANESSGEAKEG